MNEKELLTLAAAARIYGLSPPTIRGWVESKLLPCYQMPGSGRVRIARGDLNKFVEDQKTKVSAKIESLKT